MSKSIKIFYILGAILTILGSFLPWWWYEKYDPIRNSGYSPFHPEITDNGGFLIVVLSTLLILQVFQPVKFLLKSTTWVVVLGSILVFNTVFIQNGLMIQRLMAIQKPTIGIGFIMVVIGSILLLIIAVLHRRQMTTFENKPYQSSESNNILGENSVPDKFKIFFTLGLTLCILGSILPVWLAKDNRLSLAYHVDTFMPVFISQISNIEKAFFIIWLYLLVFVRIIQSVHILFKPATWYVLLSATLFTGSGYLIGKYFYLILINREDTKIQIGLIMLFLGSLLILITAISYYWRITFHKNHWGNSIISDKENKNIDIKIAYIIGAILTIHSSFLPWWLHGDLVSTAYCGVQPVYCLTSWPDISSVGSYGGYAIALLSIVFLIVAFQPVRLISKLTIWNIVIASIIMVVTGYYFNIFWSLRNLFFEPTPSSAGPFLQSGFVILMFGSILLLLTAFVEHSRFICSRDFG